MFKIKENTLLHTNVKYGIIGVSVGGVMSLIVAVFSRNGVPIRDVLVNVLYSTSITLCIANVVAQYQCRFSPANISFWKFILGYYVCNLIGMVIGMELANLIHSVFVGFKIESFQLMYYWNTSVIVLVVGTLILFYHLQKINSDAILQAKEMDMIKLSQSKTQAELQALQSKINPHFLYNALNAIVSLIHEDPDKAEEMTLKLSKLFRYSINSSQESYCLVKDEIEILNTYLDIEKVRFGNRIHFKIEVPVALEEKLVPRFLLQPLVENALKHGLKDVRENGEISVVMKKNEDRMELFIYDNGVPFPEELEAGYGMQSTFDKLQLLYKDNYDLQINNKPEKHIKISIPLT
ncbi:MAG: sensor histidine kinase [Bacteroidia bacterium]